VTGAPIAVVASIAKIEKKMTDCLMQTDLRPAQDLAWLRLSTNARQVFDYDEGKQYIQLDHPQIILEVIRDVFDTTAVQNSQYPERIADA
jgi:hypothetical protein